MERGVETKIIRIILLQTKLWSPCNLVSELRHDMNVNTERMQFYTIILFSEEGKWDPTEVHKSRTCRLAVCSLQRHQLYKTPEHWIYRTHKFQLPQNNMLLSITYFHENGDRMFCETLEFWFKLTQLVNVVGEEMATFLSGKFGVLLFDFEYLLDSVTTVIISS
jgi:hypothetical protein